MTATEVRSMLRRACVTAGTAKAWCEKHRISQSYVSDVLLGRREPGDAICKALGLESEQIYRKAKQ